MTNGPEGLYASEESRESALEADRQTEATPLPYSGLRHYENDSQRQVDLAAAEQGNIAKAAGELGLTSAEWHSMRSRLGRSPQKGDLQR